MKIKFSIPECLWNIKADLGEGITWVKSKKSVFFVDINKKKLFSFNVKNKSKKKFNFKSNLSFIFHIKKNLFLCGFEKKIKILDLNRKIFTKIITIEKNIKNNRINDGQIDPKGNLWFGTMDKNEKKKTGSLYCLNKNLILKKVDTNYIIPNGPVFISDKIFYHTESSKRIIYKITINKNFKIINKKIFIKLNKKDGYPDGMTVDQKGNLWVCKFNGYGLSIFNKKGKFIEKIKIPSKNVTKCEFGGENNKDLFIITAKTRNNKKELQKYKFSGGLFRVKTNIKGRLQKKFNLQND